MIERLRRRGTSIQPDRLTRSAPGQVIFEPPRPRRRRFGQRGQSVVEFALLAPIMIFLLFAMLDLARIWTTMMSVESAGREAADFGTTLGAERWNAGAVSDTVEKMRWRACVAASDLPDYEGVDADANGVDEDCTNPSFAYCLTPSAGGTCESAPDAAWIAANTCDDPARDPPCTVTVSLHHVFRLFVPFQLEFFGVKLGLPVSLDFVRDSTFAMTDIEVAP